MKRRRALLEVWLLNKLRVLSPEPDLFAEAMRVEAQREKAAKDAANGPPGGHNGVQGKQVPKKMEASSEDLKAKMAEMRRLKDEVFDSLNVCSGNNQLLLYPYAALYPSHRALSFFLPMALSPPYSFFSSHHLTIFSPPIKVESCERRAKNLFRDARKHFEVACKATHTPTGELKPNTAKSSSRGGNGDGEEGAEGALTARSAKSSEHSSSSEDDDDDDSDSDEDSDDEEDEDGEKDAEGAVQGAVQREISPEAEGGNIESKEEEEVKNPEMSKKTKKKKKKKKKVRKPVVVTPTEGDDDYEHPLPPPPSTVNSAPKSRPSSQPGDTSSSQTLPGSSSSSSSSGRASGAAVASTMGAAASSSSSGGKEVSAPAAAPQDSDRTPVPLLSKRALMELFFDQKSEWAQRAMGQKATRALVQKLEFEPCFVLHPVAAKKGFVTVDEFALFCVATHAILDK
jgi:hypothetical protein